MAPRPSVAGTRARLVRELKSLGRPKPGFDLRAYLGSPLPTIAVPVPELRRLGRREARALQSVAPEGRRRVLDALWGGTTIDARLLAIEILDASHDLRDDESWAMLDRWVEDATGWCLTDSIGSAPVSGFLEADPRRYRPLLRWTKSTSLWRRRVVLYAMRGDVRAHRLDRPFEVFDRLLHDPEFFVQRAVGTWLRECWKVDRLRTERYLRDRSPGIPRVVLTVATERAPPEFRRKIRALNGYRTERAASSDAA